MTGHLRGDARKRADHHIHPDAGVRALIERERRAAAVEALREAAVAADGTDLPAGEGDWLDGACDVILWLRDRADRIEAS